MISEDYRKLVELVQLEQLALTELQHRRVESELRVPLTVSTEFRVEPVTVEPGRLVARAYFDFRAKPVAPEDGDEEPQVEIRMVWRVQYALQNPGDVELDIQVLGPEFLERNVPINVWPFIRETLASLTAKMGAPLTCCLPYGLSGDRLWRQSSHWCEKLQTPRSTSPYPSEIWSSLSLLGPVCYLPCLIT